MRKNPFAVVLAAATIFLAAARPAAAQRRPDTRPIKLAIDISFINLFDQPKWMALGPELEIRLGPRFSLNPEVTVWIDQAFRGTPGSTSFRERRRTSGSAVSASAPGPSGGSPSGPRWPAAGSFRKSRLAISPDPRG